jgi:hypothetical protein
MSDLGKFSIFGKIVTPTFQLHKSHGVLSFDRETAGFGIRAVRVISSLAVHFPV